MGSTRTAKDNQNAKKIFITISKLIQDNYDKKLTNDEKFILNCLISRMNYEQIAKVHGKLKAERVRNLAEQLMNYLSGFLEEKISLDNFQPAIIKYLSGLENGSN